MIKAATLLRGAAFKWFEPTINDWVGTADPEDNTKIYFHRFAEFEKRIKKIFAIEDESRTTARTIYSIKQEGSTADYYSRFH